MMFVVIQTSLVFSAEASSEYKSDIDKALNLAVYLRTQHESTRKYIVTDTMVFFVQPFYEDFVAAVKELNRNYPVSIYSATANAGIYVKVLQPGLPKQNEVGMGFVLNHRESGMRRWKSVEAEEYLASLHTSHPMQLVLYRDVEPVAFKKVCAK